MRSNTPFLLSFLLLAACQNPGSNKDVPTYYEIGVVHRKVTTSSPEAQLWFDRGLALTYGFNHEAGHPLLREISASGSGMCHGMVG